MDCYVYCCVCRIRHLTEELQNKKVQDEREAKALESMVHSVEQNLQLMTVGIACKFPQYNFLLMICTQQSSVICLLETSSQGRKHSDKTETRHTSTTGVRASCK